MSDESGVAGPTGPSPTGQQPTSSLPGRQAAYAELVAAVLDLRSPAATAAFDQAISDAVATGQLSEPAARELRWLQRQSLRALVEHAARVLPPTLVALESEDDASGAAAVVEPTAPPPGVAETPAGDPPEPSPPVDLTARRLLVAGLRPIADPPFP